MPRPRKPVPRAPAFPSPGRRAALRGRTTMTLPVYFSRNAMRQLAEFGERYFVAAGEGLVKRLEEEVAAVVRRVRQFPASYPLVRAGVRRTLTDQLTLAVY